MKKGFTLIELLAVMAILAFLIIFVIPNVVRIINDSKRETFIVDVKSRFNTIDLNMMKQSIKEDDGTVFYRLEGDENKVPLTGKKFYYYVKVVGAGKITEMLIWDGTNTLMKKDINGVSVTKLTVDDLVDDIDTDGLTLDQIREIMN